MEETTELHSKGELQTERLTRRDFLKRSLTAGAGLLITNLLATGCGPTTPTTESGKPSKPEPKAPAPESTATPYVPPQRKAVPTEKEPTIKKWELTQPMIDEVGRSLLDPSQYPQGIIEGMEDFLRLGSQEHILGYNVGTGTIYLQIKPEKELVKDDSTAVTLIEIAISNLRPEGAATQPHLLVRIQGLRDRDQWQATGLHSNTQEKLNKIDDQHEALVTLAYVRGLNILLQRCGINSAQNLPEQSIMPEDYNRLIELLTAMVNGLHPYVEATAEMSDAPLIAQLAERNPDGTFRTVGKLDDSTGKVLYSAPVIEGRPYDDAGHFIEGIVNRLAFPPVWEAETFTAIPFSSIPPQGLEEYLAYMRKVFSPQ